MKMNKVSAFQAKCGLRRESGVEPLVVGLMPQTNPEGEPDSMSRVIMGDGRGVEREKGSWSKALFCRAPFRLRQATARQAGGCPAKERRIFREVYPG